MTSEERSLRWRSLRRQLLGEFSIQRLLKSVIFIYVVLAGVAFFFSDRLIFQPQPASYKDNQTILKLATQGNRQISAVYLPNSNATYTILYSHGNAEDIGDLLPTLQKIQSIGFSVFAYDYQGYGTSQGTPSEAGAYHDIDAAYAYVTDHLGIPSDRLIVYGRSVGGGPSLDLATRKPIAGLILESTFISAFQAVTQIPVVPFDKFSNLEKIRTLRYPVLIIHGKADRTIPFEQGQMLFRATSAPKRFLTVDGADHNDVIEVAGDLYVRALREFASSLSGSK